MRFDNQTALITGASSGIGDAFARDFARRGADLIIVARRKDRLEALAEEIRSHHDVTVTVIAADLSTPNAAAALAKTIGVKDIDILVNNAGFGHIGLVADEDPALLSEEITLNVLALTQLTNIFLPPMVSRNRGTIINVASTAAFQPIPNMAIYAATKAYVLSFTEALWGELQGTRVKALALCPGGTATEFFDVAGGRVAGGALAPISDVITTTFRALGKKKTPPSVVVGRLNATMTNIQRFVPRKTIIRATARIFTGGN